MIDEEDLGDVLESERRVGGENDVVFVKFLDVLWFARSVVLRRPDVKSAHSVKRGEKLTIKHLK